MKDTLRGVTSHFQRYDTRLLTAQSKDTTTPRSTTKADLAEEITFLNRLIWPLSALVRPAIRHTSNLDGFMHEAYFTLGVWGGIGVLVVSTVFRAVKLAALETETKLSAGGVSVMGASNSEQLLVKLAMDLALAAAFAVVLMSVWKSGLRTCHKIIVFGGVTINVIAKNTIFHMIPSMFIVSNILSFIVILQTSQDKRPLDLLAAMIQIGLVVFSILDTYDELTYGTDAALGLHPWKDTTGFHWLDHFFSLVIPPLMNYQVTKSVCESSRYQKERLMIAEDLAYRVADALAGYDLKGAAQILNSTEFDSCYRDRDVRKPLLQLLKNLRCYRPFLPRFLFATGEIDPHEAPNSKLAEVMRGKEPGSAHIDNAVSRMRDSDYSLLSFHHDMVEGYPELELYKVDEAAMSSGRSGHEEFQRTLGALYAVYCLLRLDLDGKLLLSFGIHDDGRPRAEPSGETAEKQKAFLSSVAWNKLEVLLDHADMTVVDNHGVLQLRRDRVRAMLTLTAIHDIMKNKSLLPHVQKQHAPYDGYKEGEVITDHDAALSYILEFFPSLLPSFNKLGPGQRAPIFFTQGRMGFNNGWFVQGEAPPAALFSKFKHMIVNDHASKDDISFYFVHWLTDLAGAVPFGDKPWPGSEKFASQFPVRVLSSFLHSFTFIEHLAYLNEVEVMEEYLLDRFAAFNLPVPIPGPESCVAIMRLALMAQGFEAELLAAFNRLPRADSDTLGHELARTGCMAQFSRAPHPVKAEPSGPALLIYYAPALLQKARSDCCLEALRVLAAVCRAARVLFPLDVTKVEAVVTIRIDALKVLNPRDILAGGPWYLKPTSSVDAEVATDVSAEEPHAVVIDLPVLDEVAAEFAVSSLPVALDFVDVV